MSILHLLYPIIRWNRISSVGTWLTKCGALFWMHLDVSSQHAKFVCKCGMSSPLKYLFKKSVRVYRTIQGTKSWNSFSKAHYHVLKSGLFCCTWTKMLAPFWRILEEPSVYTISKCISPVTICESTFSSDISTTKRKYEYVI